MSSAAMANLTLRLIEVPPLGHQWDLETRLTRHLSRRLRTWPHPTFQSAPDRQPQAGTAQARLSTYYPQRDAIWSPTAARPRVAYAGYRILPGPPNRKERADTE